MLLLQNNSCKEFAVGSQAVCSLPVVQNKELVFT